MRSDFLYLAAETDLATILGHIEAVEPGLVIVDSVQTIANADAEGAAGGVTQVREVTAALVRVAKQRNMPVILVGHVTKDGSVAGPRTLEHIVDVVVGFEGERHSGFRLVRAVKNRYGATDEVGCFELTDAGIVEVPDPSGLFTGAHAEPIPGTALTVTMEGRRPLTAEVQALVAPSAAEIPRRVSHGIDAGRFPMILAVLSRRAGVRLHQMDAYAATVGGARVTDPAADLAIALAVASATLDTPLPRGTIALGELGLAGEIRPVPDLGRRLAEAARLGVRQAVVPAGDHPRQSVDIGMEVIEADTLTYALSLLGLHTNRHLRVA